MTLRYSYMAERGAFVEGIADLKNPPAEAATAAMREAAVIIKTQGRAEIARAGFSKRFQNALRAEAFPRGGQVSIDAAAFMVHRVPYANVFEEGATIRGNPRLFIPLVPKGRKVPAARRTPARFRQEIGPLTYIARRGKPPLLAAPAALSVFEARKAEPKVSLAALRRGAAGAATGRTVLRTVPLFVGQSEVTIDKKFSVLKIVDRVAGRLAQLYVKHLKTD